MAKSKRVSSDLASAADLPAVASAQVTPVEAAAVNLPRFRVSLPWVPAMEIEAANQADAVQAYNGMMAILATEHTHTVTPLD